MSCGRCLPPGLDCSVDAQAERRRLLAALMAKLASGVTSVSDRGRSVSYNTNIGTLWPIILRLRNELAACETGAWPSMRRLSVIDQEKGL